MKVSPSLLAKPDDIAGAINSAPSADWWHIDVMDGIYSPEPGVICSDKAFIDPARTAAIRQLTKNYLDVHLMVSNPSGYIDKFAESGADIFCYHADAENDHRTMISRIKGNGMLAGIALNPAEPVEEIFDFMEDLFLVLLMGVVPGKCGQKYIPETTRKIEQLRRFIDKNSLDTLIHVDGGIKVDNVGLVAQAGAHAVVSGSGIFGYENPDYSVRQMKRNTY